MSEVLKRAQNRKLAHFVHCKGTNEVYYVDSVDSFDMGFETMVFKARIDKHYQLCIESWNDLYCRHYATNKDMEKGHNYIITHLEDFLEKEN